MNQENCGHDDRTERENELTTELGRVERHLYRLRKRREELLEELGHRNTSGDEIETDEFVGWEDTAVDPRERREEEGP